MFRVKEPVGKHGRLKQLWKAIEVIWFIGLINNLVLYRLLHAPFWLLFVVLGLSIVAGIWVGFFEPVEDDGIEVAPGVSD